MAERDLTRQFEAFREGFIARRGPRLRNRAQRMNRIQSNDAELGSYEPIRPTENSPIWVKTVDEIKSLVSSIKSKIKILNQLHKNRLLVRFDNSEAVKDREIDGLTREITDIFHKCEKMIKTHFSSANDYDTRYANADKVVKDNIKRQLAQELQQLSMSFRRTQKEYLQRLRSQKGGIEDILGLNSTETEENIFQTTNMKQQKLENTQDIVRDKEIQQIAENINELATIFQDLAVLVIDQGTILDRIDYNLENVQIKTEKGLEELIIADNYSKNSRPFKCIMILLGIIIFEALILLAQN